MVMDKQLLDKVSTEAKASSRLRMNRRASKRRDQTGLDYLE